MDLAERLWSEAAFVAVALLLAYGIYQTAGVALNTGTPVVAVTSGSMEPALHRGDMVVVQGERWADIETGEVVVFRVEGNPVPVVHRVVTKNATALQTQGDALDFQHPFEKHITQEQVLGTRVATIPLLGYVKLVPTCLYLELQHDTVPQTLCP
ncbi:MAG: signal peptidase I [Candidatus Nanohaloarchaea archaeon]|nr:signal peptidase I [Candidatus Nanohaloarchaea archaeon]